MGQQMRVWHRPDRMGSYSQRAARERLASSSQRAVRGAMEVRGDLRLDLFQGIGGGREAPSCQKQGAETEKTHPEVQRREREQRIERCRRAFLIPGRRRVVMLTGIVDPQLLP